MKCKKKYSKSYLYEILTKKYINKQYKEHRANLLYLKELSYIPAAQLIIERRKNNRRINETINKNIKDIEGKITVLYNKIINLNKKKDLYKIYIDHIKHNQDGNINEEVINNLLLTLNNEELILNNEDIGDLMISNAELFENGESQELNKKNFIKPCTKDNCRGLLNIDYICGICDTKYCSRCFCEKINDKKNKHECNENDLENVKEIKKSCKACPSCGVYIYNLGGCSQFFCTNCHNAFDWKTLKIIKNNKIHNPHYFEFLNNQNVWGGTIRDVDSQYCGGIPDNVMYLENTENRRIILSIINFLNGIEDVYQRSLQNTFQNLDTTELRIKFILNDITEGELKKRLQEREKRREYSQEYFQIYDMYKNCTSDLIRSVDSNEIKYKFKEFIANYNELAKYAILQLEKISKSFNVVIPQRIKLLIYNEYKNDNKYNFIFPNEYINDIKKLYKEANEIFVGKYYDYNNGIREYKRKIDNYINCSCFYDKNRIYKIVEDYKNYRISLKNEN